MAIQFVLGGSGSGKSEYVKNRAIELARADRRNSVLIVVPDQFTMQTQWQMANSHPDGGIINIDVLSFSRLPRKVFEEVGQPKRMLLDDTGKCLLIKRGATKIKDKLHVLSKGMDNAGWSGEVKSVLSEFMQYNVKPDEIDRIIGDCQSDSLKLKLSDLKLLYEAFLKECEDKYITREEILDLFVERLPLSKKIEKSFVFFDGFTGFTPIQIKAVVAIAKKAREVVITFPFDNDLSENPHKITDESSLFDLTKKNMYDISRECEKERIEVQSDIRLSENIRHKNNPELAHLEKCLFRNDENTVKSGGAIEISRCTDIDNECHELCERVLSEIKNRNYRYRDVAVICADMTGYQKPLEKYLKRYKIPYYMDSNRSIANNPLVKYILSIAEILRNNFRGEDVLKMLRTGISPFEDEEIDRLENYIYARGIKGISKWSTDFVYTSEEQRKNNEGLDEINDIRRRFFDIFKEITADGVKKKRKLSVWIKEIYDILEDGKIADKLSEASEMLKAAKRTEEAAEYGSVYNKVIELFDALTDLMGDEDYTIKELTDILKVGFSEIRVGVLPQNVDSLLVGDMQRTRLKEIKALFIVGVNDGNIPKSGASGGLLSVPDKEELKKADCVLSPTNDELAYIEQLYIYLNLTKPTDRLFLSYATIGGKGESLIPSYLIEVLKNMFEGLKEKDKETMPERLSLADVREDTGRLMGRYVSGLTDDGEEERLFKNISILRGIEGGREWCEKIIENSFREYSPVPIGKETARALYGDLLRVSISTLEQFAECRYAHFVGYGLALGRREEYGLEYVDMGNLAHDVLESVGEKLQANNLDFSNADVEMTEREIDLAIERLTKDYNGDILRCDQKTAYYATQLSRIMKRTVKTLGFQLSKGKYKPEMYEAGFEKMYDGHSVILRGRIDRADIYRDESGNEYVKIIDYKSSRRTLDPKMIEEGLSLQLAIYMKNAVEMIKEKHPDKNVLPAAMLYYAIDDPFAESRDNYEAEIRKKLIPVGAIVNDDKIMESLDESLSEPSVKSEVVKINKKKDNTPDSNSCVYSVEDFHAMLDFAEEKALELSDEILAGSIDINPVLQKNKTACQYCELKGICGFDPKIKGYGYRIIGNETENETNEES